jgi:hypothetical protein
MNDDELQAARRAPLWHGSEIEYDPRDFNWHRDTRTGQTSQQHSARDLACAVGLGLLLIVAAVVNL